MFGLDSKGRDTLSPQFKRGGKGGEIGAPTAFVPNPERLMAVTSNMNSFRRNPDVMNKLRGRVETSLAGKKVGTAEFEKLLEGELEKFAIRITEEQRDEEARMSGAAGIYESK